MDCREKRRGHLTTPQPSYKNLTPPLASSWEVRKGKNGLPRGDFDSKSGLREEALGHELIQTAATTVKRFPTSAWPEASMCLPVLDPGSPVEKYRP